MHSGHSTAPTMQFFRDHEGRIIRLTKERRDHILEHPEMRGLEPELVRTISAPQCVIESVSDSDARLYYQWLTGTAVGDKYLCVVVKIDPGDAFVLTAYLTDTIKKGRTLWPAAN